MRCFQAIEHNDIKRQRPFNANSSQKSMLSSLIRSPAPVKAVLNYMGFEAGPTRLPLVPAPAEEGNASSRL